MREEFLLNAKQLIEKKKFREALDILFQLWRNDKSPEVAIVILQGLKFHPNKKNTDSWIAKFETIFKDHAEILEQIRLFQFVKEINELSTINDSTALINAVNNILNTKRLDLRQKHTVILKAVQKFIDLNKFIKAYEFLERIDEKALDNSVKKTKYTELLKYLNLKLSLYKELKTSIEIIDLLKKSIELFPESKQYKLELIQQLIKLKKYDDAKTNLNNFINWRKPNWKYVETLAYVEYKKESFLEAWKLATKAFLTKGDQKFKIDLHMLLASIAEKLNKHELSQDLKVLSFLVRTENKLEIPKDLLSFIYTVTDHSLSINSILSKHKYDFESGEYICHQRYEGKIVWYPLDKNFARIKYNNKNTIIYKSDLNEDCSYEGATISFVLSNIIDKKTKETIKIGKLGRRLHDLTPNERK